MAEASISWAQDQFICSVCLDLLNDPVAIPCGHSYCMSCITICWNQEDQKRGYRCPQCKQTFSPRPALNKNTILAEMVEKLKKTKVQADVSAQCSAGDVQCDVCTEIKHKAVKSCLMCLNSYCQHHVQQHETFFKGKRHNLIDATGRQQEIICPEHDKPMEIYCRTDKRCVCYQCTMNEHQNHDTVSAAGERTEKQRVLVDTKRKYHQRIKQIEKELKDLRDVLESYKSVSILKEKLEDFYKEIDKISDRVTGINITTNNEPKTRQEFIQYFCQLTLDTNTMNKNLNLTWSKRRISYTNRVQQYPDHPDRFDDVCQVLCRESLCGRCYWEIEWSTSISSSVCISVSYKGISRKGRGDECGFGCNDHSWSLFCSSSKCSFYHNNNCTNLPVVSRSCMIGVYVDHSAGSLSFYRVSDQMKLIHRVNTTIHSTAISWVLA